MRPSFNTSGPCVPGKHYLLSPEPRFRGVMELIDEEKYFTLHAGRQTGKSTSAQWLVKWYNAGDTYRALWIDIQTAREQTDSVRAFRAILSKIELALQMYWPNAPRVEPAELLADPDTAILRYLQHLSRESDRPLVLLIDEADSLVGPTMVSFLTQLRDGYVARGLLPFPHSVALIGQRQVRDYVFSQKDRRAAAWLGSASPFNITAEAATLRAFTKEDVFELLLQHTTQTGQRWEPEAMELIYELSQGHPWLVNAMADQVVNRDVEDRAVTVTADHVEAAKETIILAWRSHVDSLAARLHEDRVRRVMEPMLAGGRAIGDTLNDDFSYVMGLGLIANIDGEHQIANSIYREIIPRVLSYDQQVQITHKTHWYVRADGTLDLRKLLEGWQVFWREDGHLATEGFSYKECGPHLMLMAFLQRLVNGGGRIAREYGLGRGALDLLVTWKGERHGIEVKLRRDTETDARALDQVAGSLDTLGEAFGWLVLFDLRKTASWDEKLFVREVEHGGKRIWIVGC